jgi:hypothetical protein
MGCQAPAAPPPQNIAVQNAVPSTPTQPVVVYPSDIPKPLPDPSAQEPPPPAFDDPPLVDQRLPEEAWFVSTYNRVGRPRIAVFVNRTLDGQIVGEENTPTYTSETVRTATTGVDVQSSQGSGSGSYYYSQNQQSSGQFKSNGPGEYHETTSVYLQPGQYDDAALRSLDYVEMESLITDWMRAEGQVTLISPGFVRGHLSNDQINDLQNGKASALDELVKATGADVFVQIEARPVKRGDQLMVLLVAEAINVRGGEILAQASVEMPTPVDRYALNNYTRFLARKLMHEMANTWTAAPVPAPAGAPAPQTPPATRP